MLHLKRNENLVARFESMKRESVVLFRDENDFFRTVVRCGQLKEFRVAQLVHDGHFLVDLVPVDRLDAAHVLGRSLGARRSVRQPEHDAETALAQLFVNGVAFGKVRLARLDLDVVVLERWPLLVLVVVVVSRFVGDVRRNKLMASTASAVVAVVVVAVLIVDSLQDDRVGRAARLAASVNVLGAHSELVRQVRLEAVDNVARRVAPASN